MALDEAALHILQELDAKADQVRSPSAYIQRAVNNFKVPPSTGHGGGLVSSSRRPPPVREAPAGPDGLDEKAQQALASADPDAAAHVMAELETKGSEIRNPSAYVQRALSNARMGYGAAAGPREEGQSGGLSEEVQAELGTLPSPLDEKATAALDELSSEAALKIVRSLLRQSAQISNISAWVCKAVGNEKRSGGGANMEPPHKRLRS